MQQNSWDPEFTFDFVTIRDAIKAITPNLMLNSIEEFSSGWNNYLLILYIQRM